MCTGASLRQRCGAPARADSAVADRRWVQHQLEENLKAIQTTLDRHHEAIAQLIRQSPPAPSEFPTTLAAPAASALLPPVGPVAPLARPSQSGLGSDSRSSPSSPVFRVAPAILEGSPGSEFSDAPGQNGMNTGTRDLEEEQLEKAHLQQLKKAKKQAYKQKVGRREKSSDNNDGEGVPIVDDIVKPVQDMPHLKSSRLKKIHGALKKVDIMEGMTEKARMMTFFSFIENGPLDMIMGTIVISNAAVMFVQSQWLGALASDALGLTTGAAAAWGENTGSTFETIETVYIVIYMIELVIRILVLRSAWAWSAEGGIQYANLMDAVITTISAVSTFLLSQSDMNLSVARAIRLLRLTRTLRVMRVMILFRPLRVLASTFLASIGALFWSMILLMILKFIGGLLLAQSLHSFILDEQEEMTDRVWMFDYYGSAWKAVYSMFELTHSGGWPNYARPVVEKVSIWYAWFFMSYVTLVIFAIIRIITAIFLKETLATAAGDAALAVQEKVRSKEKYVSSLEDIFLEADDDGNGVITRAEMDAAVSNPVVLHYLSILEIEVHEVEPLFDLLDDGDGQVTIKEFCQGIMRLKGQARSLDVISIMHDANIIMTQCREVKRSLSHIEEVLGVSSGVNDSRRDKLRSL
ncbi:Scn11a, partial [Symbiodinium necroappetens]